MASPLGSAILGASTFCARQHRPDECDSKGLPLTLNSVNVLGRFQRLRALSHPRLCAYLDAVKCKNERVILVCEHYEDSLDNHIHSGQFSTLKALRRVAYQALQALAYLDEQGLTHRALSPSCILLTPESSVKLAGYGLYYMTGHGSYVRFPISSPRYMAPEIIAEGPHSKVVSSPKVDVWSLGLILLELFMASPIYPDLFLRNALGNLLKRLALLVQNYQRTAASPLLSLLEAHSCLDKPLDPLLKTFLEACLTPLPSKRPAARELLSHEFFAGLNNQPNHQNGCHLSQPFLSLCRCQSLELPAYQGGVAGSCDQGGVARSCDPLSECSLREVHYLWSLAGAEVEGDMLRAHLIQSKPPVFTLPRLVVREGEVFGLARDVVSLYDPSVLPLSLHQLRKRLEGVAPEVCYPVLEGNSGSLADAHDSSSLPLLIKEKDVEYQFHRVVLFSRLLTGYPYCRSRLVSEALVDVCPLLRADIWASLLGVEGDIQQQYMAIDKASETSTDRQIAVDVPRCHQYHPLLASSTGHAKFLRVLKAWVVSHPKLVYWQGLDSLCAPFLSLNFNNEALAYSCLSAFIGRYLHKFFLKDNSPIMQEYLAVFSHTISYHDPELFNHLDSISFIPELYAIPWFLTMFAHILPLNKIYHLWDTLLLGNCSFPLCVGVAILQQLRRDLLASDFNECILMFSDLPDIDIQMCIHDAVRTLHSIPPSACVRTHEHIPSQPSTVPPETRRDPVPLSTLKLECCPQVSTHDFILMCGLEAQALGYGSFPWGQEEAEMRRANPLLARTLHGSGGEGWRGRGVAVDIRSQEEFRHGHVPHSLNLPHLQGFQPNGSLSASLAATQLQAHRGWPVAVVANKGETGPVFARQLVRLNFPRVCLVHGGVGALRSLGLLSSLHNDP